MKESITQNILSVYITSFIPSALTYFFWLLSANYTDPEVIGTVVALGSFSMILGVVAGLEVSIGMKRFLGIAISGKNFSEFKQIFSASIIFTTLSAIFVLLIVLHPSLGILEKIGIDEKFVPIIIAIVIGNSIVNVLVNGLISALKSRLTVIPYLVSSAGRFPVMFGLFWLIGVSDMSVAWAYSSHYITLSLILLGVMIFLLRRYSGFFLKNFFYNTKLVIHGSLAKWVPQLIGVIEQSLGILAIFALKGPLETGIFYISYAIFGVISMIPSSINSVSHPVLSGMESNQQKDFLKKSLKFGFMLTLPLSSMAFFYAKPILSVFGESFSVSTEILSILLISVPIAIIVDGCYYLIFARGNYRNVLILGFTVNGARIVLYASLVPTFGAIGSAIGYVIGSIVQLVATLILIKKIELKLQYRIYAIIGIIPFSIGYFFSIISLEFIGAPLILIVSWVTYSKLKLVQEEDIETLLGAILTKEKAKERGTQIVMMLKKLKLM